MSWKIEFLPQAEKDMRAIDKPERARIFSFLRERVAGLDDPRSIGEALRGKELGKYWKYRVGNYRVICSIRDARITILVVNVGHRREVYR